MAKKLTTQVKLIAFLVVALLIPVGLANFILYKARQATSQLAIVLAVKNLPTQAETSLDFVEFVNGNTDKLDKLVNGLKFLESFSRVFLIGSVLFIPLATGGFWLLLVSISLPMRDVIQKLFTFRNEDRGPDDVDVFQAAAEFDRFLATSRNIMSETRSISQELMKKIEPLTTMHVFSDENVKQFFTDVQELSRSSN